MNDPIFYKNNIPFFYPKSQFEITHDIYEHFDLSVKDQIKLHLSDQLWSGYPFQKILDFIENAIHPFNDFHILEIGCGVGRMASSIAFKFPHSSIWGVDYSFQMLNQARKSFIEGRSLNLSFENEGLGIIQHKSSALSNLKFGLTTAENLPFDNESQDFVYSSFTLDRLKNPLKGIDEMSRVLKKDGKLAIISPLNFIEKQHWIELYPTNKLIALLEQNGHQIIEYKDNFIVEQPFDRRGNKKIWNCVAIICVKED